MPYAENAPAATRTGTTAATNGHSAGARCCPNASPTYASVPPIAVPVMSAHATGPRTTPATGTIARPRHGTAPIKPPPQQAAAPAPSWTAAVGNGSRPSRASGLAGFGTAFSSGFDGAAGVVGVVDD